MFTELPRILSPNLGCPIILPPEELHSAGLDVVTAEGENSSAGQLRLVARPSFPGEGEEFSLELRDREELTERTLPTQFQRVEETRFLISTVLHSFIFAGKSRFFRYRAKLTSPLPGGALRPAGKELRPILYDLILKKGEQEFTSVFHALCVRPGKGRLRSIHLTDLHISLRNDLYGGKSRSFYPIQRKGSLPFEKGRRGGISGKAFFKPQNSYKKRKIL